MDAANSSDGLLQCSSMELMRASVRVVGRVATPGVQQPLSVLQSNCLSALLPLLTALSAARAFGWP